MRNDTSLLGMTKKSTLLANALVSKTPRSVVKDEILPNGCDGDGSSYCNIGSVDFENTENLYIERESLLSLFYDKKPSNCQAFFVKFDCCRYLHEEV
ncbi:hypothetical protein J6U78_07405 [bacterium]|nr:hypothetical protein [bacterium]